jgi:hypothetical protein
MPTDSLDPTDITSLLNNEDLQAFKDEFRQKVLDPLLKEIKNIKKEDIKKMLNPFGISDAPKDFISEIEKYRKKVKESMKMDISDNPDKKEDSEKRKSPTEKVKDTPAAAVLPQSLETSQKPQQDEEQKTLGPKVQLIEFSDKTESFFKSLFKNIGTDPKEHEELKKYFKESLAKQDEMLQGSKEGGILGTLGKLLALGGVATLLITAFWGKIKPWLEDKLGTKLDFLDKFKGIAEGISKFFTMGGLKIAFGGITSLVGKAFTSFGDLIEGVLKGAIKMILPAAEGVGEGAAAAAKGGGLFKGLLPKIAGGLFKGIGQTFLKGIPLIGSLISFYFSYDRFKSGDYIGAVIDLVGGLSNLLVFTPLAPLALPISLGAAALNAFLDYKTEGTGAEGQKSKMGALTGIFTGLGNMLMKVPFIKSLVGGITGTWDFITSIISGDIAGMQIGLDGMKNIPIFAPIASFFENILLAGTPTNAAAGATFSATSLMDSIKKRVGKTILGWFSWLPSWLYSDIAKFMGIPLDSKGNIDETPVAPPLSSPQKLAQDEIEKRKKSLEVSKKAGQAPVSPVEQTQAEQEKVSKQNEAQADNKIKNKKIEPAKQNAPESQGFDLGSLNPMESLGNLMNEFSKIDLGGDNSKESNLKYEPTSKEIPKILEEKQDSKYEPIKQDAPPKSTDSDVLIQKTSDASMDVTKAVHKLINAIYDNINNQVPINISSGGGSSNTSKDYLFGPMRDPNSSAREGWWINSDRIRATV